MKLAFSILLDPGHGGLDPGASNLGIQEKTLTLNTALELRAAIAQEFPLSRVDLTRTSDTYISPSARRSLELKANPDAFISIHFNASDNVKASGTETIYRDALDLTLATHIQAALVSTLGLPNRGVKDDDDELKRTLAVLSSPTIPSVLVEPGFLTNPIDLAIISDSKLVAKALVRGIANWIAQL